MKTQITRFTVIAALSVSAFVSVGSFANSAHAASASDLADWQNNYGTSATASADGDVDGRDFLVWQRGGSPAADSGDHLTWQTHFGTGFTGGVRVATGDID